MTIPASLSRKNLKTLAWRHAHRDSKSKRADGTRCVLHFVEGSGTCLVPLASLTVAQLVRKIPTMHRPNGWQLVDAAEPVG